MLTLSAGYTLVLQDGHFGGGIGVNGIMDADGEKTSQKKLTFLFLPITNAEPKLLQKIFLL